MEFPRSRRHPQPHEYEYERVSRAGAATTSTMTTYQDRGRKLDGISAATQVAAAASSSPPDVMVQEGNRVSVEVRGEQRRGTILRISGGGLDGLAKVQLDVGSDADASSLLGPGAPPAIWRKVAVLLPLDDDDVAVDFDNSPPKSSSPFPRDPIGSAGGERERSESKEARTDGVATRLRHRRGAGVATSGLRAAVESRVAAAAAAVERSGYANSAAEAAKYVEDRQRERNATAKGRTSEGKRKVGGASETASSGGKKGDDDDDDDDDDNDDYDDDEDGGGGGGGEGGGQKRSLSGPLNAGEMKRREIMASVSEARRARELRDAEAVRLDGERRRALREAERSRKRREFVVAEARRQQAAEGEARAARAAVEEERRAREERDAERKRNEFVEAAAQRQRAAEAELRARLDAEVRVRGE